MFLAGEPASVIDEALAELHPQFLDQVASLNRVSAETARESNPIATVLAALFKAYRHAHEADAESMALNVNKTNKAAFLERYQINFREENRIEGAPGARPLHRAQSAGQRLRPRLPHALRPAVRTAVLKRPGDNTGSGVRDRYPSGAIQHPDLRHKLFTQLNCLSTLARPPSRFLNPCCRVSE